jgi:16S rRNA (guanine(966)-N(2))-methyltransferase RsmD
MRIIAGEARGRPIIAPNGQDTRPTQDHVRESLFNILMRDVPDARVLDLFAGSGALALEAVSRGAESAVLVDHAAEAVACIRRNIETVRADTCATVLHCGWEEALRRLHSEGRTFTLAFLDPPYRITDTGAQCARMADLNLLAQDAVIVVEHHWAHPPSLDARFVPRSERRYGDTAVHLYRYQGGVMTDV